MMMQVPSLPVAQQQSNTTNTTTSTSTTTAATTTNRRMDEPFPLKLHRLLEDVENTPQAEILSWDPDGRSFTILQPKTFAESIMGQYFRQTKYKSFQRQMNLYGFTREVRGKIRGVYSHPRFIRHNRDLCISIKRTSKAPTSPRFFGASSSSPILGSMKSGVTTSATSAAVHHNHNNIIHNNDAAATSIDVSSPLFAPLSHQTTLMNPINLGLGTAITKTLPPLPNITNNNSNNNSTAAPSFIFPMGGLGGTFHASSRVSLDDEESMGTIDELPTMMVSFQQQQQHQHHLFGGVGVGEEQETTTSEELAVAAV